MVRGLRGVLNEAARTPSEPIPHPVSLAEASGAEREAPGSSGLGWGAGKGSPLLMDSLGCGFDLASFKGEGREVHL